MKFEKKAQILNYKRKNNKKRSKIDKLSLARAAKLQKKNLNATHVISEVSTIVDNRDKMQLVEHTLSTETPRTITRLTNVQCKKMEDNRAKKKLYHSSFQNVEKNRERTKSIRRNNPEYVFNNLEKVRENLKNKETKEKIFKM